MPHIHVLGLGPGPARYMTLETRDLLLSEHPVYLRTTAHPTVEEISHWGCRYTSFDHMYQQAQNFESLYQQIVKTLLSEARAHQTIVYAVPGNPLVAESTVTTLLQKAEEQDDLTVSLHSAVSCIDVMCESLNIDPTDGLHVLDALRFEPEHLHLDQPTLIVQVYSQAIASEVKLTLLDRLDPEFPIHVIRAAGCADERHEHIALEDLDRLDWIDHLTTLYVPMAPPEQRSGLVRLNQVVAALRDPDTGCPWDLKQDHHSLKKFFLEEVYEVVEAIENDDIDALCEELGDVLFQVYLHAQLASEEDFFDLNEVAHGIADKLIYRHPHVFSDTRVENAEEVIQNWEQLKAAEKEEKSGAPLSVLSGITQTLPALSLSEKIGKKVARVGFDWSDVSGVFAKIDEEYAELKAAAENEDLQDIFHELGDALFTLVNLARWYKLDPEDALRQTCHRFTRRFQAMENALQGRALNALSEAEFERYWQDAKKVVG